MKAIFLLLLTFLVIPFLHAQNSPVFDKAVYIAGKDSLPYRLLLPANYDKRKQYPLVLFLHGAGERGKDNELQLALLPKAFLTNADRKKNACILLVPQCGKEDVWVNFPHFPESLQATSEPTPSARLALELLDNVMKQLPVDAQRVYVMGYSMGGEATFDLLTRRPGLFAAAVPICSVADTSKAHLIHQVPVWAFHGDKDDINDVKYSRMMIAAIKMHGGTPKYTEYPGMNHYILERVYQEPALFDWLFSQKRTTHVPK